MLDKIENRKESGFTIVEVMIVLAIAGLVILIVFLAVPALQRNSRNTQRSSDVGLVGGAVNECLANRNGQAAQCSTPAQIGAYVNPATDLSQFTALAVSTAVPTGNATFTTIHVALASTCDDAGAARVASASPRAIALLFNTENSTGGAVSRCQEV